jgi:hypothetical protein
MVKIFQADDKRTGFTVTYEEERRGLRLDWLIFPPTEPVRDYASLFPALYKQMEGTTQWLTNTAKSQGYFESSHSPVEEAKVPLWRRDPVPLLTQSFVMKSAQGPVVEPKPDLFHTLNLLMLEDYFIQTSLVMPANLGKEAGDIREEAHNLVAAVIREPALTEELLKLAGDYAAKPLEDEGRKAADSMIAISADSQTIKPSFPGEGITDCLKEAETTAPGSQKDLLRAFTIGSMLVQLQGGDFDDQITEGARMMCEVFTAVQKATPALKSPRCDQLAAEVKAGNAASYLRAKMLAPVTK